MCATHQPIVSLPVSRPRPYLPAVLRCLQLQLRAPQQGGRHAPGANLCSVWQCRVGGAKAPHYGRAVYACCCCVSSATFVECGICALALRPGPPHSSVLPAPPSGMPQVPDDALCLRDQRAPHLCCAWRRRGGCLWLRARSSQRHPPALRGAELHVNALWAARLSDCPGHQLHIEASHCDRDRGRLSDLKICIFHCCRPSAPQMGTYSTPWCSPSRQDGGPPCLPTVLSCAAHCPRQPGASRGSHVGGVDQISHFQRWLHY